MEQTPKSTRVHKVWGMDQQDVSTKNILMDITNEDKNSKETPRLNLECKRQEKKIQFQKEKIVSYKRRLDTHLKENKEIKKELNKFKSETKLKKAKANDYIQGLKSKLETNTNENVKLREAALSHEYAQANVQKELEFLQAENKNKGDIILGLQYYRAKESKESQGTVDGLLATISSQVKEEESLKEKLAQAKLQISTLKEHYDHEILNQQARYQCMVTKLYSSNEALKEDNAKKREELEKLYSQRRPDSMTDEMLEAKRTLERVVQHMEEVDSKLKKTDCAKKRSITYFDE